MTAVLELGDVSVDVLRKDIKNLHLSVHPPTGRVRISAPRRARLEVVRAFAIAHLGWIRRQQRRMRMQAREPVRDYVDRESHFVWGERVMLRVVERDGPPSVTSGARRLTLRIRPATETALRQKTVEAWYRDELRRAALPLVARWEKRLGVKAQRVYVQRMKTKWGGCNVTTHNIRLNTELAKKPVECLDYVVLHELLHLRERTHSPRFFALLDQHLPSWSHVRQMLNDLPLAA